MKTISKILAIAAAVLMLCSIMPMAALSVAAEEGAWTLVTNASDLAAGDQIIIVATNEKYAMGDHTGGNNSPSVQVTKNSDNTIDYVTGIAIITLEAGTSANSFAFNTSKGYLYAASTSKNQLKTQTTKSANGSFTITIASSGVATVKSVGNTSRGWMRFNSSNSPKIFACYGNGQADISIYKWISAAGGEDSECEHVWVDADCTTPKTCSACGATEGEALGHNYVEDIIDATCTQTGTATYECSVCGHSYDETLPIIPHNYVDGKCSVCGAEEPAITETTITFDANKSQRIEFSTTKQVWQNGPLTFTNNKAGAQSNVADYGAPVRLYKGSEIVVECIGMTQIVFDCNNTNYATVLKNSIGNAATVSNDKVTVLLNGENSFTIGSLSDQVRIDSIVVTAAKAEADCKHTNAKSCDKFCPECGALINEEAAHKSNAEHPCYEGTCEYCGETVAAVDHVLDANDICTVCGLVPTPEKPVDPENPQEYVFSDFTAGTQYAKNEKHYLDNAITVITDDGHFTKELRLYSSSSNNSTAIIKSKKDISAIVLNAGNKMDVLNLYISEDGKVYEAVEITSTNYNDYTVLIPEMTKYIKLDVEGDQQVRIAKMTLYFDGEMPESPCEHENAKDCDTHCPDCEELINENAAHKSDAEFACQDGECVYCGEPVAALDHTAGAEADCDSAQVCTVCGTELKAALGHTEETIPGKDATCTETGLTDGVKCSVCGEILTAQETIEALGHTEETIPGKDATCTETGLTAGVKCSVCDEILTAQETIPALDHVYDHAFDADCNTCGTIRETVGQLPIVFNGNSVSEEVSGLAFKFTIAAEGVEVDGTKAIYDNATITIEGVEYKLVGMGAHVSNGKMQSSGNNFIDIPAVYLCDLEADTASFAVRVIKIPEDKGNVEITAVPYYVYADADGNKYTIEGAAQVATYNGVLNAN